MSLKSFSLALFLVVALVSSTLAKPIPTFDDVEKAWKAGHSERDIFAAQAIQHPTPSWHLARSDEDIQSRVSNYVAGYLDTSRTHSGRSASPDAAEEKFQGALDERTMAVRSAVAVAKRGMSTAAKVRNFVASYLEEKFKDGSVKAREEEMAPVLRPSRGRRWSF